MRVRVASIPSGPGRQETLGRTLGLNVYFVAYIDLFREVSARRTSLAVVYFSSLTYLP